jgi:monothiol glutaredoxin
MSDVQMSGIQARIAEDVKNNDVLLYMKGTPVFPQCGFSSMVVQILSHLGVKFKAVDVLADPEIRQGIKEFSNWPTVPQLYVKGEFVGGADILREMFEADELKSFLAERGVALEPAA